MRAPHAPQTFALALLALLLGGCASLLHDGPERPETILRRTYAHLQPAPVIAALHRAAFDAGYTPAFSRDGEGFHAFELLDRSFIGSDRLRRIEAHIGREGDSTVLHLRIHSVDADDGHGYRVQKQDRSLARDFVSALNEALPVTVSRL